MGQKISTVLQPKRYICLSIQVLQYAGLSCVPETHSSIARK
jgi:hypothetical protein